MNATTIGTYQVPGGGSYTLTVPDDEIGKQKLTAALAALETAETSEMGLRFFTVVLSILTSRSIEECYTMIPLGTVSLMWADIRTWISGLVPVRPC